MVKRILSSAIVLSAILSTSNAFAADLPMNAPTYAPAPQHPLWTGFYAGVNVGGAWGSAGTPFSSSDMTGFIGGGQLGYNWQVDQVVFGIEGDLQGSSQSVSASGVIAGIPFNVDQKVPWFGTVRGRLGYAAGSWLPYVTGGVGWVSYQIDVSAPGGSVSDSTTKAAWTLGGGVEWMFVPQWSTKLEYLYMATGDTSVTLFGTAFTGHAQDNIVRAGVNYHF